MRSQSAAGAGGVAMLLLVLAAARPAADDPIPTQVTFTREIRAILTARCASCHRTGGPAPMPLTTYEDVRPWARAIKEQVLSRRMPMWHAARGYGAFANDPTLTPFEMALIVSWVDGGLPRGAAGARAPVASARVSVASAFRRKGGVPAVTVPPGATRATARVPARWISGWSFEPGDPLIASADISSDAGAVGTWVAGDADVTLPRGTAIRVSGRLRVDVLRRAPAEYERPFAARRSVLRLMTRSTRPPRRAWTEPATCGTPHIGRAAELIAFRPLLGDGGAARVWVERTGASKTIIGWFRDFDTRYMRAYWLARPADFPVEARLQSDGPCEAQVTLASR
jgi:mono/diheme cytochrome c family protein